MGLRAIFEKLGLVGPIDHGQPLLKLTTADGKKSHYVECSCANRDDVTDTLYAMPDGDLLGYMYAEVLNKPAGSDAQNVLIGKPLHYAETAMAAADPASVPVPHADRDYILFQTARGELVTAPLAFANTSFDPHTSVIERGLDKYWSNDYYSQLTEDAYHKVMDNMDKEVADANGWGHDTIGSREGRRPYSGSKPGM